jgi:hypothetical protein
MPYYERVYDPIYLGFVATSFSVSLLLSLNHVDDRHLCCVLSLSLSLLLSLNHVDDRHLCCVLSLSFHSTLPPLAVRPHRRPHRPKPFVLVPLCVIFLLY